MMPRSCELCTSASKSTPAATVAICAQDRQRRRPAPSPPPSRTPAHLDPGLSALAALEHVDLDQVLGAARRRAVCPQLLRTGGDGDRPELTAPLPTSAHLLRHILGQAGRVQHPRRRVDVPSRPSHEAVERRSGEVTLRALASLADSAQDAPHVVRRRWLHVHLPPKQARALSVKGGISGGGGNFIHTLALVPPRHRHRPRPRPRPRSRHLPHPHPAPLAHVEQPDRIRRARGCRERDHGARAWQSAGADEHVAHIVCDRRVRQAQRGTARCGGHAVGAVGVQRARRASHRSLRRG